MNEKTKLVLVALPLTEEQKRQYEAAAPHWRFIFQGPEAIHRDLAREAQIIIGNLPPRLVQDSPNLEWLQLSYAGADAFLVPGTLPRQVLLTNASGAYGLAVSEHMVGLVFQLKKKLHLYRDNQGKGLWRDEGPVSAVRGSRVLVIGPGDIGGCFARSMKALGCRVTGLRRRELPCPDYLDEVYLIDKLDELLPAADIVAIAAPGGPGTKGMFGEKQFSRMKPSAILVNVGRGSIVDTDALCRALEGGKLFGAALDVVDPEPLPADHPLWRLPGAVITPHSSGGYHLTQTRDSIVEICLENLKVYAAGGSPANIVDRGLGYRA